MPLLKCQSSKSTPQKVIAYVTDKNKGEFVSVRNLFDDEDYAEQLEKAKNLMSVSTIISSCRAIERTRFHQTKRIFTLKN